MTRFRLPRVLREFVERDDNADLRAWVADLPAVVADIAARWELRLDPPYDPGGYTAWVAPALTADGRRVVLKVGWAHPDGAHEADGLRLWNGAGAVELLAAAAYDRTNALLLERCEPGTQLSAAATEPDQDEVVAGLLRRLWMVAVPPVHPFRPLWRMCDEWAAEAEERFETSTADRDAGLVRAGLAALRELPHDRTDPVVLCTDLHGGNILAATREPWLLIDPKPHVGDPAYDVVQHMLNCPGRLAADPLALAARMAGLLDLDADRVTGWLFARCVQESVVKRDGVTPRRSASLPSGRPPWAG